METHMGQGRTGWHSDSRAMHITFSAATLEQARAKGCPDCITSILGGLQDDPWRSSLYCKRGICKRGNIREKSSHLYLGSCMVWRRKTDSLPSTSVDSHTEAIRTTHRSKKLDKTYQY